MAHARSLAVRDALEAWASSSVTVGPLPERKRPAWPIAPALAAVLPEGGFPQGSVVELASPANLGHGLGVALAACSASQEASTRHGGEMAWCAFLDPDGTLFGPAVQASGVCLDRLLVLRPPRHLLAKVAVRVALSRIFSIIAVDVAAVPGASPSSKAHRSESMAAWSKVTRRLSLAVEKTPTTVFLLTRAEALRPSAFGAPGKHPKGWSPWGTPEGVDFPGSSALPAAMRVELENGGPESLLVRVAKDRFGRVSSPRRIAWTRPSPGASVRAASG